MLNIRTVTIYVFIFIPTCMPSFIFGCAVENNTMIVNYYDNVYYLYIYRIIYGVIKTFPYNFGGLKKMYLSNYTKFIFSGTMYYIYYTILYT